MNISIQLSDVTTGYRGKPVTRDINAYLQAGELTCLLGPNGAGKSTLLKTLSAFIPPLSGEITIEGVNIRKISASMLARSIAVVLTRRPATMNMTVEELVSIGRSPYTSFFGGLHENDREVVDKSIRLVGIDDLRTRNVNTLSDGERQKALIAKALAQQTRIIFLDEPTAFLDYPSKVEIMQLLYTIAREENKTVFMSTHDLELALQIADKIWLLDKERGLNIGIPEDLAYAGLLGDYFQRGGLKFNYTTGLFEIDNEQKGSVCLKGSGRLFNMVKKALKRMGYSTDPSSRGVTIEIISDANGNEHIVYDVETLN
ncbi:MAG: ABC transporter ATP-binding protein [Muribaculaceae bacterium]|nr:ABC transporter ATP-binding protein [Muribaculaceae bacterium]